MTGRVYRCDNTWCSMVGDELLVAPLEMPAVPGIVAGWPEIVCAKCGRNMVIIRAKVVL